MGNYKLSLVTAPTIEPVTVTEVKNSLRIDSTDDDTLIGNLITAARTGAEAYTRRSFITQTWAMFMDNFVIDRTPEPWWDGVRQAAISTLQGKEFIDMPLAPLISITSYKTYSNANVASTFAASNYYVSTYTGDFAGKGAITLRNGSVWPQFERNKDGIEIEFVCGYGATAADVPQQIRMAILDEATFLYNNRSSCDGGMMSSGVAKSLLTQFRILEV